MVNPKLPAFFYGGDYNPEQWPEEVWQEDMRLFKLANINVATVAVFSWALLEPSEGQYDFTWLDKVMDMLYENGMYACLATSTAAQPAWMSKKYPGILPVTIDGQKREHGRRVNFCPNSFDYRRASQALVRQLALRYKDHPALVAWHVGNEYGTYCYCENCAKAFRQWLKERYGSLEELNKRWYTNFWGHTIYDWDEIVPPSHLSETFSRGYMEGTYFQGMAIDYNRFMSDSSLACYKGEYDIIKEITPDMPVTTNLMGTFKPLDYFSWAKHMDVISWDNYPSNKAVMSNIAMRHDLMRGLKAGQPFMLMEQTPSQQNWQPYNGLKRPGIMRLWSYQAVAHGADTVMFFQLRQSRGACEKYHGAVISHAGHENTRVFREVSQLGEELKKLGDKILDSRINARVAIIFDWENWWATEYSSGPSIDLKYVPQIEKYYKAFYDMNIPVDMINEDADFSGYDVVIAPLMYMVKPGVNGRLEDFVKNGGTFVTTFFSGLVDENDLVVMGGYPGQLRQLLGIWVEETDALFPDMKNSIIINRPFGNLHGQYQCGLLCDIVHLEGAQALGAYGSDFYAGMPAITVNDFGSGKAYYVASDPEDAFVKEFVRYICDQKSIKPIMDVPANVEVTQRIKDNTVFTFILNHNEHAVMVELEPQVQHELLSDKYLSGASVIPARGVFILES